MRVKIKKLGDEVNAIFLFFIGANDLYERVQGMFHQSLTFIVIRIKVDFEYD